MSRGHEQFTFHYLSDNHEKILSMIKRREKKVITDYIDTSEFYKQVNPKFAKDFHYPPINEALEKVIVKCRNRVISAYPLLKTKYQFENETWLKLDTRKNAPAQKFGSLLVSATMADVQLEMWKNDNLVFEISAEVTERTETEFTLQSFGSKELISCWKGAAPPPLNGEDSEELINFPLFIPPNWENIWTINKQTQFLYIST